MSAAQFRLYAELNDFVPPERRQVAFELTFSGRTPVKDLIERLGVPHTEVDLVLVNDEPADFARTIEHGDRVAVFPMFASIDIESVTKVRPGPLTEPRFVADVHLGKLATYLRLLGFDTLYRNDYSDADLAAISEREARALLTRDRGLLKRGQVTHACLVRADTPREQLLEVLQRFRLAARAEPFSRCLRCNGPLEAVAKEAVVHRLQPLTKRYYHEFRQCTACARLYWRGTHHARLQRFVEEVLREASPGIS